MRRRGFSLVEITVVLFIGVVVMFSLLPLTARLLRQQAGLNASRLSVEMFPLVYERLSGDLSRASAVALSPPFPARAFRLDLTPLREEDPEISWTVAPGVVSRTNVRKKPDGEVVSATSTWTLSGTLALDAGELENGRLLLRWEDGSGTELGKELLPLLSGRPTENVP